MASLNGVLPPNVTYSQLVEEAEYLLHRQRQKGADYKFRDGPGRPAVALSTDAALGATAAASPRKDGGGSPTGSPGKKAEATGGGGEGGGGGSALDAYDPKEVAQRELRDLTETVSKMRAEASTLAAECKALDERYEKLKLAQKQLAYEDTVDEDRNRGLDAMKALKGKLDGLDEQIGETEQYSKTLLHMLRRSEEQKLSELAALKAFEDSLSVHRAELDLAEGVLRQVNKARDEEQTALAKLHTDLRKEMAALDKKLEGRRAEVKVRQEKARWRMAKAAEEAALKNVAQGMLSEEQERAMIEKAKNLTAEHDILRQEKLATQAEADAVEKEFAAIRFAAGVRQDAAAPGGKQPEAAAGDDQPFAEAKPDPGPIVARFAQLEEEIHGIENALAEYAQLLSLQQQQLGVLGVLKQPRARDIADEADRDVEVLEALQRRVEAAKRAGEGMARDLDTSRSLRLHLEQSLSDISERVRALPPVDVRPPSTPAELGWARAAEELGAASSALPTEWARATSQKAVALARAVHAVLHVVNGNAAASGAKAAAGAWERSEPGRAAAMARPADAPALFSDKAKTEDARGEEEAGSALAAEEAEEAARIAARDAATEKVLEATVESLVVSNEWSVRVRPGSSGPSRPSRSITGKALTDAVAAFERTWRDGAVSDAHAAREAESGGTGGGGGLPPRPGYSGDAALRRKSITDMLTDAYATVSATVGLSESPRPEDIKAAGVPADTAAAKPKARDIQRFLAVASAMVGDELEEGISTAGGAAVAAAAAAAVAARRDGSAADSVLSLRERVKLESMAKVREGRAKAELASAREK